MNKIATMDLNKYWGISLPLQRTVETHRQGWAIRYNLFFRRTMPLLKKGFPLLSLMQKTLFNKIYNFNLNDAT